MDDTTKAEWIVIRPEHSSTDSELSPSIEGEWRHRADVGDADWLEVDGTDGPVRAFPTDRVETSPAGDLGQVWEIPSSDDASDDASDDGSTPPHDDGS